MVKKPLLLWVALGGCAAAPDHTDVVEAPGWRSELFPTGWSPAFTGEDGKFLHDFSYAGYAYGEEPPRREGPRFDVVADHGADPEGGVDSTPAFQAALVAASAGGGVVWVPAGLYRLDGVLTLSASNVVIRGEGPSSRLAFTRHVGMSDRAHLTLGAPPTYGPALSLLEDGEARADRVRLADVGDLQAGDVVAVGWRISDPFVADHGMTGTWVAFRDQWKPFFRRTVVSVEPDGTVVLDVPLRYPARVRDEASVRRIQGLIREVGVEDVAVSTAVDWYDAWKQDRSHALDLIGVEDAWVRGLTTFPSPFPADGRELHLQSGGVRILDAHRVTVADSVLVGAQNRGEGGNGYLYEISRSNEVLIRDSVGAGGRHNFIQNWDFGTSGCVWLRTTSRDGRAMISDGASFGLPGLSEFHHSLALANLVDSSVADDGWQAVNRGDFSSGAGHSATQNVFWNLSGAGQLRSFQFGYGYVIGTTGLSVATALDSPDPFGAPTGTAPEDHVEGLEAGADLDPPSLYLAQRAARLGR